MNQDNRLRVPTRRVSEPCEECGATNYPNLEVSLAEVRVVLCRSCLQREVDVINRALEDTRGEQEQ